jgi:hypothetical protein
MYARRNQLLPASVTDASASKLPTTCTAVWWPALTFSAFLARWASVGGVMMPGGVGTVLSTVRSDDTGGKLLLLPPATCTLGAARTRAT